MTTPEEVETAEVVRVPLWTDRRTDRGPFDIIGDVHGCSRELVALLEKLGYEIGEGGSTAGHPLGRRAVFLGDLVDRGPDTPGVLRLVMGMVADGSAVAIPGNHENKLLRALRGRNVQVTHGLAESLQQLGEEPPEFVERVKVFLDGLVSHYLFDEGRLVVAHAGLRQEMHGRASAAVRDFALYGDTTGESDEFGLPVRYPWAQDYRGSAMVVYGHTPVPEPEWLNRTICIDTGCVFGGSLTALRYPEKELVSVPAERTYYEPIRPLSEGTGVPAAEATRGSDRLDIEDVLGKRHIETRLARSVTIREENAAAALEAMSRFAADPRWLVYLPPTMAPVATTSVEGLLEHPGEAFAAYRHEGVASVICQEKHMGSRAIIVVGRDREAVARRFGIDGRAGGLTYTRTGRPFFHDAATDAALLDRLREAIGRAGLWAELETDWLILDAELLPWSAKAEALIKEQYAAVGAAGTAALRASLEALDAAGAWGRPVENLRARARSRAEALDGFVAAYRRYSRPVQSVDDLRVAPFQVLAGEGRVHLDRPHGWHMEVAARLSEASEGSVIPTDHRRVDTSDPAAEEAAIAWWEELAEAGGEGIVVKPEDPISRGRRGVVQPGLKVRAREYLRIIYGPEYTLPGNFERLRERSLGRKRSLAVREFALGVEALERFVRGEPLYRVHECVFGILALESEPVDPRL
jgi:protein phosphatase